MLLYTGRMELTEKKKLWLSTIGAAVAGLLLGALVVAYFTYSFRNLVCAMSDARAAAIEAASQSSTGSGAAISLNPGSAVYGTIRSKEERQFTLETVRADSTRSTLVVAFDPQQDTVTIVRQSGTTANQSAGSYADLKTGQQVLVTVSQSGKVIYLAP